MQSKLCFALAATCGFLALVFTSWTFSGEGKEDIRITKAKARGVFYFDNLNKLLQKYCSKTEWKLGTEKDQVVFRGTLKAGGDELILRFKVYYDIIDKSNNKGWLVEIKEVTRNGQRLEQWEVEIFPDEAKIAAQFEKDKANADKKK